MASESRCSKVERDSCTAGQGGVVRAAPGVHGCRRRPVAQQRARGLHDKETWWADKHCSIRWEPPGEWFLRHMSRHRGIRKCLLVFQAFTAVITGGAKAWDTAN